MADQRKREKIVRVIVVQVGSLKIENLGPRKGQEEKGGEDHCDWQGDYVGERVWWGGLDHNETKKSKWKLINGSHIAG
jgi:hypothetical protein